MQTRKPKITCTLFISPLSPEKKYLYLYLYLYTVCKFEIPHLIIINTFLLLIHVSSVHAHVFVASVAAAAQDYLFSAPILVLAKSRAFFLKAGGLKPFFQRLDGSLAFFPKAGWLVAFFSKGWMAGWLVAFFSKGWVVLLPFFPKAGWLVAFFSKGWMAGWLFAFFSKGWVVLLPFFPKADNSLVTSFAEVPKTLELRDTSHKASPSAPGPLPWSSPSVHTAP